MDETEFIKNFFFSTADGIISNLIENVATHYGGTADIELLKRTKRRKKPKKEENPLMKRLEEIIPEYTDDLFKEYFRMSRRTCSKLIGLIKINRAGNADYYAELTKKVLFTIWYLTTPEGFGAVGNRFGLAKSSSYKVYREILSTLYIMRKNIIKFPDRNESNKEALLFQRRSRGFPGVVGAVNMCHIPIKSPSVHRTYFCNENKRCSIILQGICDHKARFIDVYIGIPSQMNVSKGFKQSKIFKKLTDNTSPLLPPNLHIVGDSDYPLLENLMTPYRNNCQLTQEQENFNFKLMACHSINALAFAMLKSNFRRLDYLDINTPEVGKDIISATCTLHNFLIDNKEIDYRRVNTDEQTFQEENQLAYGIVEDGNASATAKRNFIAEQLL